MVAIFAIRLSPFLFSNPPKYTLFALSPENLSSSVTFKYYLEELQNLKNI